jgi:hypothetical protein
MYAINLNASYKQLTTFHKLTQVYANCVWVNEASSMVIERKQGVYTVWFDDNFNCVITVTANLETAKLRVLEQYYALKTMLLTK